jgi:hypothetical protein
MKVMLRTFLISSALLLALVGVDFESQPALAADAKASEADTSPTKGNQAPENLGQRKQGAVGESEQLGFRQAKVSSEMTELEERMYRLSEALKRTEPENSSRLMSGVKYARTELIQHEMQEIESILAKADYKLATGQEKELLAKLTRLEQLLLSTDLDLQIQLQQLRALRDVIHRLDSAIKEEDREQKISGANADRQQQMKNLPALREKLDELIRRQTAHVAAGSKLSDATAAETPTTTTSEGESKTAADDHPADKSASVEPPTVEELRADQDKTRDDTKTLEERLAELAAARGHMDQSLPLLKASSVGEALPHQKDALDELKKLAAQLEARQKEFKESLAQEKFNAMRRDQEQNHASTDMTTEMVRDLGDAGAGALGEMSRAAGNMGGAEGHLGNRQPDLAGEKQNDALNSLKYAREQLSQEEEKLLNKIRAEVKKRVLEGITDMLERQVAVRESTQRLSPKMKDASRQVLNTVVGLSKSEEQIMQVGENLVAMVEETEFGIALPAALRAVVEEMDEVKSHLAAGEATSEVVEAERQIEADLKALLEAMKQLPAQGNGKQQRGGGQDRQRELNRILAELKMIRILQQRVNRETEQTDHTRSDDEKKITSDLQHKIQTLHDRQQDIYDVTDKLNNERGNELQ